MTTIREKFGPKFEALFLDGRDRSNPMVGSQLQLGADGEYFNSNTRNLWRYYLAGVEDGTANALDADEPEPEPAPEPVEPEGIDPCCWDCNGAGDGAGSKCSTCWTHPF